MLVEEATKMFYKSMLKKHGRLPQALGWGSRGSQRARFNALVGCFNPIANEYSVLDVGCGFGDLARYLSVAFSTKDIHYLGIDFVDEMIQEAALNLRKYTLSNVSWTVFNADLIVMRSLLLDNPWYDYVVASGIFAFASYIKIYTTVRDMFVLAKNKVIFNCLKEGYEGKKLSGVDEHEFYANPEKVKIICEEFGNVEIFEGYLPNDFTVSIERESHMGGVVKGL